MEKVKVLIYGTGSGAKKFLESDLNYDTADIIAFVETDKTKEQYNGINVISADSINELEYDLIIVASSFVNEIFDILKNVNADVNKCVFIYDLFFNAEHIYKNMDAFLRAVKNNGKFDKKKMKRYLSLVNGRKNEKYIMAEVDNLNFIGKNNDFIMDIMLYNQRTYSYNELEIFFDLSHKYYDVDDNGYFFDCGCNILTSAIYALSKKRNLKAVAFEPIKETFKFARINCILNNMEDRTTLINTALSNINTTLLMECSEGDYRRSSVVFSGEGLSNIDSYESVNAVTLDDWCEATNFDVDKINYIWIDVEGYEGYLIDGAKNILKKKKIPLYLEFVSDFLKKTGSYDLLIKNLSELYSYFIVVTHSSNEKTFDYELKPISELNNLGDSCDCNLFMVP